MDNIIKIFKKILPIYWAFLTFMLLRPGIENVEYTFMFSGLDKIVHFSIFAFLAFCFRAAYPKLQFWYFVQILLIYAMLTEVLQQEMHWGRSLEFFDLVADALGIMVGYLVYKKLERTYL